MSERRKEADGEVKKSDLPRDFLGLIEQVFNENFGESLKSLKQLTQAEHVFKAHGEVYPDEVLVTISLNDQEHHTATSFHASVDYDPKASYPTIQDVLNSCVDAIGALYHSLTDPAHPKFEEKLLTLTEFSISAVKDIPYEWTGLKVGKQTVFLKVDKVNPELEALTDQWLEKNDPDFEKNRKKEQAETEDLFVTGDKAKRAGPTGGSGAIH